MTMRLATAAAVAAAVLSAGHATGARRVAPVATPAASRIAVEYRYRVYGRIRLAVFWTRGSLVGSARMSARGTPDHSELTFLLGSEPASAPRGLNQWSYVREETNRGRASAFAVRTLSADDLVDRTRPAMPDDALFAASCAFVQSGSVRSLLTTVNGTGATYRMFSRLLDSVARAPRWEDRQLPHPDGVAAGLLSAMHALVGRTGADPRSLEAAPPLAYVYAGALYTLSVRNAQTIAPVQVGAARFERVTRVEFAVFNRTTRSVTRFSAMFLPGATPPLPVQLLFQPNFWVRVELRLDDGADAPADPSADAATLARIRSICSGAGERAQTATGRPPAAPRN